MRPRGAKSSVVVITAVIGLGAGTALASTSAATAADQARSGGVPSSSGHGSADEAARLLRADAVDPVRIVREGDGDGEAQLVATLGDPVDAAGVPAQASAVQAAAAHVTRYAALFGLDQPRAELDASQVVTTSGGDRIVKFTQQVDGLPVIGGELAVSLDATGAMESVNGETTDAEGVLPAPSEAGAAATRTALTTTARTYGVPAASLTAAPAQQWFYDPALIGSPDPFGARPVWRVEVSDGGSIHQLVLVDAAGGGVVESVNQVLHANVRAVCDLENRPTADPDPPCRRDNYARVTGGPVNAGRPAANAAFAAAGDAWELYRRVGLDLNSMIGRNAGDGRKIRLTVNLAADPVAGPNAFWNGREAYFNGGLVADDIVAHELSHGVVQHTAGLFPAYQPGAMNESMADVFGELVDQANGNAGQRDWEIGEDATALPTLRDMQSPRRFDDPDRMRSSLFDGDPAFQDAGGVHTNSGIGNKTAFLIAQGGRFNGRTVRGLDRGQALRLETARIYFRALQMLTSGSDYADLGRVLPQACSRLAGSGQGDDRITASDCAQVRRAVAATQLTAQPRRAAVPEAPRCTPRNAASRRLFFDNFERSSRRVWAMQRLWDRLPRSGNRLVDIPFATSGRHSLFGFDPDPAQGDPARSSAELRRAIRVPNAGRTFLRFDHAYVFEFRPNGTRFFDGGLVELSLNGGRTWSSASGLRWVNGPDRRIVAQGGFRGFGGESHGYQSSRLDLSRFGGRTVRLRWTVRGDPAVAFAGWWLDDVDVYTCRRR